MKISLRFLAAALVPALLGLAAPPAGAQFAEPDTLYDGGSLSFSYAQTPFPFYSGTFQAEGGGLLPDGGFPPGAEAAVGGGSFAAQPDTVTTVIYGVTASPDDTYDGAMIVLRTAGPLTAGSYPVDTEGGTAIFLFIDDAQQFSLPEGQEFDEVMDWLESLQADRILVSISGTIHVAAASADTLQGTFSGLTVDPDNLVFFVNVSNGQFALSGADQASWAPGVPLAASPEVRAHPNPFNPQTSIVFSLPSAQTIEAAIYDLAGRRVRTLYRGALGQGEQRLLWRGQDEADRRAPAGVYLVRIRGDRWQSSVKVTLAP